MRPRSAAQRAAITRAETRRRLARGAAFLAGLELSAAQRDQGQVSVLDLSLADQAQRLRPGVRWWWGEATRQGRRGAWCHLCQAFITAGTIRRPLTRTAQAAILEHRDQAHGLAASTQGPTSPTTQAGAGQPDRRP